MSDAVRDAHQEFWRPPLSQPNSGANLAESCRRCGTEFMVGSTFCHICGTSRHRADLVPSRSWIEHLNFLRALEFTRVKDWFGLPLPALAAFLLGIAFLIVALAMGLVTIHDTADFEAVQLWRIQWLIVACACFLAGILLRSRKPHQK